MTDSNAPVATPSGDPGHGPNAHWLTEPLPGASDYDPRRALRFTQTILKIRSSRERVRYTLYVSALFAMFYGLPSIISVVNGLASPSVRGLWSNPVAQQSLAPAICLALVLLLQVARIRGPVAPKPADVDFVVASQLPRRRTLLPTWLAGAATCTGIFAVVALTSTLGLSRALGVSGSVSVLVFAGGLCVGVTASAVWLCGQLLPRFTGLLRGYLLVALAVQALLLVVSLATGQGPLEGTTSSVVNLLTGPGGWASELWRAGVRNHLGATAYLALALLVVTAASVLAGPRALSLLRLEELRSQARRTSAAVNSIATGDLRSARTGLVRPGAGLRRVRLSEGGGLLALTLRRDALGALRNPQLPLLGCAALIAAGLVLGATFSHPNGSVFAAPVALVLAYWGLSLLNEGSRQHSDNGGRTSLFGASYPRLALAHCGFPAVAFIVCLELGGLAAFVQGYGHPLALAWSLLLLPVMLGMQTVSVYRGGMPLAVMVGSPTAPGSGPVMMLLWLIYPFVLSMGALWPLTHFAAQGEPLLRMVGGLVLAATLAAWAGRGQARRHNRRRAVEGTLLERMQAQADAAKAEADAERAARTVSPTTRGGGAGSGAPRRPKRNRR
ncbi:hypothetical protein JT358_08335 [Micrococcales bacterium 31B]|nr:hypothetical protein [Micrococcales bacterium 31B]